MEEIACVTAAKYIFSLSQTRPLLSAHNTHNLHVVYYYIDVLSSSGLQAVNFSLSQANYFDFHSRQPWPRLWLHGRSSAQHGNFSGN